MLISITLGIAILNSNSDMPISFSVENQNYGQTMGSNSLSSPVIALNSNTFIKKGNSDHEINSNTNNFSTGILSAESNNMSPSGFGYSLNLSDNSENTIAENDVIEINYQTVATSVQSPSVDIYQSSLALQNPVLSNNKKTQKENKNSFGTTIASGSKGISFLSTPNIENPMAPPCCPSTVPLDGGSLMLIILGAIIGIYKIFLKSNFKNSPNTIP